MTYPLARKAHSGFLAFFYPQKPAGVGWFARLPVWSCPVYTEEDYPENTFMKKLDNYLRAFRKRSGLSQKELAYLLGGKTESLVNKHELWHRTPSLPSLVAYEHIFQTSLRMLFAGFSGKVVTAVDARIEKLCWELSAKPHSVPRARKLVFLRAIRTRGANQQF